MHITVSEVKKKLFRKEIVESHCKACDWQHTAQTREEADEASMMHSLFPEKHAK